MSEKKIEQNMILCCIIFAVYAVLTLIGAANHELWFDEAQAWTIARDNDIAGILDQLRFEGHPPLWYLILFVPSHMGLPCTVMPYISWFITAIAGAIIMFKAPFNIAARAVVLFSGGFLFVNSVMSRVYCLINLIAVLTALLYPKRKEHPVLYGFLIALLANTHICMSGFIGIIGIFMLIDLFSNFRSKSIKQKAGEITGLFIAGAGVLILVIPLINALSLNSFTSDTTFSLWIGISSVFESFFNISYALFNYGQPYKGAAAALLYFGGYILAGIMAAALVIMIIIMHRKTRPFLMLVFFWAFYAVTTEVLWLTIPNRANIFVLMYFIIAWISEYEPQNNSADLWSKIDLKAETAAIQKLIGAIKSLDTGFMKSYIPVMTAVMLISVPVGAYYLFSDYAKDFCPSETAAEYIRSNFPEDSIFITDGDNCPQLAAYLPEYKFYSVGYGRYYTYMSHEKSGGVYYKDIYDDLKEYNDLYYLYVASDIGYIPNNREIIYTLRDGIPYSSNILYIEISAFDLEKEIGSNI